MELQESDGEFWQLVEEEYARQKNTIDLIASENYPSRNVLKALGSVFVCKYSEGYAGKRYYPGNETIDKVEMLAQERAKKLFKLGDEWSVNVQPYSGSPANLAVYVALLKKEDVALGMRLSHGGHLTHGHSVSYTGKAFNFQQYGVKDDGWMDYDEVEKLAKQFKPRLIVTGYSAYSRALDYKRLREIADMNSSLLMVDMAHFSGLVAAEAFPSPFPFVDIVTTTTHKTLRGPRGAMIFSRGEELTEKVTKEGKKEKVMEKISEKINRGVFPGLQGGPHNNQTAAIAVALKEAMSPEFKKYGQQIVKNARAMCAEVMKNGFKVLTGGTDNHLFVMDFRGMEMTGKDATQNLCNTGLVVSMSTVPNDPKPPTICSGIRIGTPAMTTRGMKEAEAKEIANMISDTLKDGGSAEKLAARKKKVLSMCDKFPLPF